MSPGIHHQAYGQICHWFLSWSERSETQRKTTIHCSYELEQPAAYAADGDESSEKSEQDQLDSKKLIIPDRISKSSELVDRLQLENVVTIRWRRAC